MLWVIIALLLALLFISAMMHVFSYSGYQSQVELHRDEMIEVQKKTYKEAYEHGISEGISRERLRVLREEYARYSASVESQN